MNILKNTTKENYFLYIPVFLLIIFAMAQRLGVGIADDGAFFLRYAQNMVNGYFWVWNPGESPIWGASAPIFPLIICIPMYFGIAPMTSLIGCSLLMGASALTIVFSVLHKKFGQVASFTFLLFSISDSHFMWYGGVAGLETPLTFLILSLGFLAISNNNNILIGIVSGLLAINKLDLLPAAFFLLVAATYINGKINYKTILIAISIPLIWYTFCWIYFGSPLPNSFSTKAFFQDQEKIITWMWFGKFILYEHFHYFLVIISLFLVFKFRNKKYVSVIILFFGLFISHLVAYTIKYPFEPYTWYPMPALFSLIILASLGAQSLFDYLSKSKYSILFTPLFLFILIITSFFYGINEINVTDGIKHYVMFEKDRVDAGKWVSNNTPNNFKVFTYWGNPAYFSNRYVIDGSFLNRKFEKGDVVDKYKPEVLILDPGHRDGYTLVKVINKAKDIGVDYPFGIHIRNDVLNRVANIDKNLESCNTGKACIYSQKPLFKSVSKMVFGDIYGLVRPDKDSNVIFIHPGLNTHTQFNLNIDSESNKSQKFFNANFMISPEVTMEAIDRGAGIVGIKIFDNSSNKEILKRIIVNYREPKSINLAYDHEYTITVDGNGNADTDWLLLTIN